MKLKDRFKYLAKSPKLAWDILLRGRYSFLYDLMPARAEQMSMRKRLNLGMAGINLIYRRTHSWSWPMHSHIELVNYCNINCRVCPTGLGQLQRKPTTMDPALFERLINEIGPYLLSASLWGWGEPLLHPELASILRLVQGRGFTTFISTNGQKLSDPKVLKTLIEYPPTYLIVCMDGTVDETNSKFRVNAKVEPILDGVKQLASIKASRGLKLPILHMRYIVMKHNEHELTILPKFAEENQFDMLTIRTLAIIDSPDNIHTSFLPENKKFRAYAYKGEHRVQRSDFSCEKAFTFPAIFADGTVVACDQDCNGTQNYGTMADGASFKSLWWSKQADKIRKRIRDYPDSLSFCVNCPFKDMPVATVSRDSYIYSRYIYK
jgi:radical SAM protein with 4Fe4S-binding SPASM domain